MPETPDDAVAAGPGSYWDPRRWEPGELFGESWECFKRDWPVLLGALFVGWLILFAVVVVTVLFLVGSGGLIHRGAPPSPRILVLFGLFMILALLVHAGWLKVFISSARGENPEIGLLFAGTERFLPFLGVTFLQALLVTVGLVLFIVPGIVLALGLLCAPYWVVDAGFGPIEALKASWAASRGNRWRIFLFLIFCLGVMLAGQAACGIGVLIAFPLVQLAQALLYLRLTQGEASDRA